jgi:peroxiredoxin
MERSLRNAVIGLALYGACCFYPVAALAYRAEVGDRAANFKGYDIVHHRAVQLDDYFGKWVLVEYWATWCYPCMYELPNMIAQTAPYVAVGDLNVITVNVDDASALRDVKKVLRKYRMPYPVIYDGGEAENPEGFGTIPAMEWGVKCIPASFLIDPRGVIVATEIRGPKLAPTLDFYLHGDRPIMGLRGHHFVHPDGAISVYAEVMSPTREDVRVELYTYQVRLLWNEQAGNYKEDVTYADELTQSALVSIGEFGETTYEFQLPPDKDLYLFIYLLKALVPGSESIGDANDRGIKLCYDGDAVTLLDVENVDGKYVIHGPLRNVT